MPSAWGSSFGSAWGAAWGAIGSGGWYGRRRKYIVEDKILYATDRELAAYLANIGVEPEAVQQKVSVPQEQTILDDAPIKEDEWGFQYVSLSVSSLEFQPVQIDNRLAQAIAALIRKMEDDEEDDIECLLLAA